MWPVLVTFIIAAPMCFAVYKANKRMFAEWEAACPPDENGMTELPGPS